MMMVVLCSAWILFVIEKIFCFLLLSLPPIPFQGCPSPPSFFEFSRQFEAQMCSLLVHYFTCFIPFPPILVINRAIPFWVFFIVSTSRLFLPYRVNLFTVFSQVQGMQNLSHSHHTMGSGSRTTRRTFEFGRTYVVRPKGKHEATIVWLHGLGDNGSSWSQLLESLPLPNIKWICPTAPTRPVALLGGFPCTTWFDVGELSEDGPDDWEGLDASAAHIANLLSTEPSDVKVGIGGFSMGAAMAFYSATAFALGRYGNGIPYPINLRAVVGLSGWLPGSRGLRNKIEVSHEASRRAASLPILLSHGTCDDVVPYKYGEKSALSLSVSGFQNLTFKTYEGIGHYTVPKEMDEVCNWLTARLGLEGSR